MNNHSFYLNQVGMLKLLDFYLLFTILHIDEFSVLWGFVWFCKILDEDSVTRGVHDSVNDKQIYH